MRSGKDIASALEAGFKDYLEKHDIHGLSLGVVLNRELVYAKGFGVSEAAMFHSASISKTFVATAIMQLYERKLINLDSCVVDYLPYFRMKDERYRRITIRQMLNHTSGMPDVHDYEWESPQYDEGALERYVRSLNDKELLWEPGERFAYSNMAYEILGDMISKVSGRSFEDYMKENILLPLDMAKTTYLINDVSEDVITKPHILDISTGYRAKENTYYPYNRIHAPSSTLWSNPTEMCRYAITALQRGSYNGDQLLQPESYDVMWRPAAETGKDSAKIGFSWFLRNYKGVDLVYHTGGDTGYCSNLVLIPERAAAFSMFCDCDFLSLSMVTDHILDIMLGFEVQAMKTSAVPEIAKVIFSMGKEAAAAKFEDIRQNHKDNYYISDAEFNRLAYRYKQIGRVEDGMEVLNMAVREFPNAANIYDSLGEFYLEMGERETAIGYFKKALGLNPHSSNSISALKNLGAEVQL